MKLHRPLTAAERGTLAAHLQTLEGVKTAFEKSQQTLEALLGKRQANAAEQSTLRAQARNGGTAEAGLLIAAERAGEFITSAIERAEQQEEAALKPRLRSVQAARQEIIAIGHGMEAAYTRKIALEMRPHFDNEAWAIEVASYTQTVKNIAFHFDARRGVFGLADEMWAADLVQSTAAILEGEIRALLEGRDFIAPVVPFPLGEESADRENEETEATETTAAHA